MFYGVIHEEYEYQYCILAEFDLKGTLISIKDKIKNGILKLLDAIERFLDKCKDGKIKSALKAIISRLRKLLGDTEEIKNQRDAERIAKKYKNEKEAFERVTVRTKTGTFSYGHVKDYFKGKLDAKHKGLVVYRASENELTARDIYTMDITDTNTVCMCVYDVDTHEVLYKKNMSFDNINSNLQADLIEANGVIIISA